MKNVVPLILSGGSGSRLWPLSRATKPKQFLSFGMHQTLFQQAVLRCKGGIFGSIPVVIGSSDHRFLIAEDLLGLGIHAEILLEPEARNTCMAIASGCLHVMERDPDLLMLAIAADHYIPDQNAFAAAVETACPDAMAGNIVAFGARPTAPNPGYGYMQPGERLETTRRIASFIEKPQADEIQRLIDRNCLWNTGNLLFRPQAFLDELELLEPAILSAARQAYAGRSNDLDFLRLGKAGYKDAKNISVDYAVMEKTSRGAVMPIGYEWSDIRNWQSVSALLPRDESGNSLSGQASVLQGTNNVVHSQGRLTAIAGVDDTIVITSRDAVLVTAASNAEAVGQLVEQLAAQGKKQALEAVQIFRPWGNYEQIDAGQGYQVKRITVKPGGVLSLQKHRHRAEHWVVVSGEAEVTIGERVKTVKANQSAYVPLGEVHRLANRTSEPVVMIEVQSGDYLGEDDIVRLEDNYNRSEKPEGVMN